MRLLILIRGYFEAEISASMKLSKGASRVTEHWATGFVFMSVTMECFCFKVPSDQELAMEGEREREVPPCLSSLRHVTDCIVQDIPKRFANGHDVPMACPLAKRFGMSCTMQSVTCRRLERHGGTSVYGMWLIALYKTFQNALPMGMTFPWHARLGGLFAELQSLKSGWEPGSPMIQDSHRHVISDPN